MAKGMYPTKACPNCGELIHARRQSHPVCGWEMDASAVSKGKKNRKKPAANGREASATIVTYDEIAAVKKLVETIGAEKVEQLARVFAK